MSLLFASDTIDYLLHWRINLQIVTNRSFNKYHICFPLICSYNKIISLSEHCVYKIKINETFHLSTQNFAQKYMIISQMY